MVGPSMTKGDIHANAAKPNQFTTSAQRTWKVEPLISRSCCNIYTLWCILDEGVDITVQFKVGAGGICLLQMLTV